MKTTYLLFFTKDEDQMTNVLHLTQTIMFLILADTTQQLVPYKKNIMVDVKIIVFKTE